MILNIILGVVALLGWAFAAQFYYELWKWAKQCNHARIIIAYNRKVRLQAPLTEFIGWINQLDKDKDSHGRVIYAMGKTSVAISKAVVPKKVMPWARWRKWKDSRRGSQKKNEKASVNSAKNTAAPRTTSSV